MKIFVGYDTREDIKYQVCEYSIKQHQPKSEVLPLKMKELRAYKREQKRSENSKISRPRKNKLSHFLGVR
jgi:hypothetical protein